MGICCPENCCQHGKFGWTVGVPHQWFGGGTICGAPPLLLFFIITVVVGVGVIGGGGIGGEGGCCVQWWWEEKGCGLLLMPNWVLGFANILSRKVVAQLVCIAWNASIYQSLCGTTGWALMFDSLALFLRLCVQFTNVVLFLILYNNNVISG